MAGKPSVVGVRRSDEATLRAIVGASALSRGRAYASRGAVESATWDPSGMRVSGLVRGTADEPYQVSVMLTRRPDGRVRSVAGSCSCPVGRDCKHAVALLYSTPSAAVPPTRPAATPPAWPVVPSIRAVPAVPVSARPPSPVAGPGDQWESTLQTLIGSMAPSGRSVRSRTLHTMSDTALGLQFEWVASRPVAGRQAAVPGRPGVRMRPVTLSERGNWVRSGVSWTSLDYVQGWRAGRAPVAVGLLRELRALARLGDARRWVASGEEALWLESVASRRVWDLLAEAEGAGLGLVTAGRDAGPVTLQKRPARASLDVVRADGGALSVEVGLADAEDGAGGESGVDLGSAGAWACLLVGRPAHGVVWLDRGPNPALRMARLEAALPDPVAALVEERRRLVVPSDAVVRFESELYPALRRHLPVVSNDGSYVPPAVEPDRVVCALTHGPGPILDIDWALAAGTGARRPITDDPDPLAEKAIGRVVDALGWHDQLVVAAAGGLTPVPGRLSGMAAARFMTMTLPALQAIDGLEVLQGGPAPDYREITEAPTVRLRASQAGSDPGRTDWLDLGVEVEVGGEAVPFEELFVALAEDAPFLLLPSGGYFSLEREELRRLAELIAEARALHDAAPGVVRLSRFSASLYEDLSALADVDMSGWSDSIMSLASCHPAERPLPAGILAELRPYQREGFGWLAERFERRLGAILADDMGLGKTLQALALICDARERDHEAGPFLVVAPASVVGGWMTEAARFAPGLRAVALTETTRRRGTPVRDMAAGADMVVTSYAIFRLDQEHFADQPWAGLLLDEAQFVKNPASHAARAARSLPCAWKLAMTGTPLENSLAELWSLTAVTCPGLLGRPDRFDAAYRHPVERRSDGATLERLRRRIRPVMLRRTKAEVLVDLPEKQESVIELELDPRHRRRYETQLQRERQKLLGLIGDMKANRVEILSALTRLRQAALDVSLVDPAATNIPSTKLDHLEELLGEAVADGHRVLVFSQFTRFLSRARARADAAGIASCYLDGRTRKRAEVIDRFRHEDVAVFFISLKAGGFGLNLTEADHAVFLDPWWNPATEAQAVDRIHRIGQTRKVMVHRLVARGTIEEKVMALKDRKAKLFDSVMGADGFASAALSAADVEALLA